MNRKLQLIEDNAKTLLKILITEGGYSQRDIKRVLDDLYEELPKYG